MVDLSELCHQQEEATACQDVGERGSLGDAKDTEWLLLQLASQSTWGSMDWKHCWDTPEVIVVVFLWFPKKVLFCFSFFFLQKQHCVVKKGKWKKGT